MRRRARPGDWLVVDDRSGFVHWASEMRHEWNGSLVHKSLWEARHPQDFVRGKKDDMAVPFSRPRPTDAYTGPLVTEVTQTCNAGQRTIYVLHSERMQVGDVVVIALDNTDMFRAVIEQILSATSIFLHHPLPGSTSAGMKVINYTAVSPITIT